MNLRHLIPFFDTSAQSWALEARLLRWLTFLWLMIGLAALFSASFPVADADFGDGLYYFKRQVMWILVGLVGFNLLVHSPLRYALGMAHWFLILILGLIFATLVPGIGTTVNGATRWLSLGPVPLQPSELIKPFLVLQSARLFGQWNRFSSTYRVVWLIIFAAVLAGILLQPNLSTTALCGMTLWLIAMAAGIPYAYLGGTALGGLLLATLSISIVEPGYARSELSAWRRPTIAP